MPDPTPYDYEHDPERYRRGMRLSGTHSGADLYRMIASVLAEAGARLIADIGCAQGALSEAVGRTGLGQTTVLGLDSSAAMLAAHPGPSVRGDAAALPFRSASLDAVVTVNTLDHLADPLPALVAAHRVLRPGGLFLAAAIGRTDSPELAEFWRPPGTPFDAEDAPELVRAVFGEVEVRAWDAPLVRLPDAAAIGDYLRTRFASAAAVAAAIRGCEPPLWITKRGALVLAGRSGVHKGR